MGDIAGLTGVEDGGDYLYRPGKIAQRMNFWWVRVADRDLWRLRAGLWPAATANQADAFLEALQEGNRKADFLSLNGKEGWIVEPDLNISFALRRLARA